MRYLGVSTDENLSWKNHVDCVITKASKIMGMVPKLRHFVPLSVLQNIYKSLSLPYLTHGLVAQGNASKNYLNKVVVLQKRVLRLISLLNICQRNPSQKGKKRAFSRYSRDCVFLYGDRC